MSKQDIDNRIGDGFNFDVHFYSHGGRNDLIDFILDTAKQESIGFNDWVESNRFMKHRGLWYDSKHDGERWDDFPKYTKEQLYELYKKSN